MTYYQEFRSAAIDGGEHAAPESVSHSGLRAVRDANGIQVIVINRADAKERLMFQTEQLDRFNLKFLRLEAYTPETTSTELPKRYWKRWRHPLSPEDRATFLSHALAWEWVKKNGPALILEDDAILANVVPDILKNLESVKGVDHLSLEVRGRRKLVSKSHIPIGHGISGHKLYLDRAGAAAYVLWPTGAKKLMERTRNRAVPPEGMAQWANQLSSYQADPACAVQVDMAELYGLLPPIAEPQIARADRPPHSVTVAHQYRMIANRAHKLWRIIRYKLSTERRFVPLRREFFD